MISGLDSSTQQFLTELASTTRRIERAQRQISSGKRISVASDDPDRVSSLVQANSELAVAEQVKNGMSRVKAEVDSSEVALASAVKLMEQARVLAAQGATSTTTAQMRKSLSDQVAVIMEQMVSIANTNVGGRYVFSGDTDQSPAYTFDITQVPPVSLYSGTPSTRRILDASGSAFSTSRTAQEIFDSGNAGESIFGTLNQLRLALQADDTDATVAAAQDISTSGSYLSVQHAFYGSIQQRVNTSMSEASATILRLNEQIATVENTDMVAAALDLNDAITVRDAALAARGKMPKSSLFDYLG